MKRTHRKFTPHRLAHLPVCVCLSLGMLGTASSASALEVNAPTIQEVNAALNAEDYASMESMCREIVAEDTGNAQGWFLLGYALHAQGELDEAILMHITATSFPQTAPLAYYNLGCAQSLKGNADQAFKALEKAAALGVTNPQQFRGDSDLNNLHDDPRWKDLMDSISPALAPAPAAASAASASASSSSTKSDSSKAKDKKSDASPESAMKFWVGNWDVYSAKTGKLAGHNKLSYRVNKHVIHERWESEGGSYSGESWNHYDPIAKAWRQTWLGSTGDVTQFIADTKSDAKGIMFIGKAFDPKDDGGYTLHRMHVRPIEGKRVRQTGSESTDDGATWVVKYDLIYVKKGEEFSLEDLSI